MALNLVLHTFRMIFGNFGQALRVSVGPYLLLMILAGVVLLVFGQGMAGTQVNGQIPPGFALGFILLIPLFLFVTAWVAVSWHRFILLEEYAGILPTVTDRPIWPYVGKVILMSLLMMVIIIPLVLVFAIIGVPFIEAPGVSASFSVVGIIMAIVFIVFFFVLSLRLGVALVGTALGKPMTFGAAWRATKTINKTIIGVAVILGVLNILAGTILTALGAMTPLLGSILSLGLNWLTMMIGISILTTIYGHVIEERPLIS